MNMFQILGEKMKLTSKEARELLEIERRKVTNDKWIDHCLR